MSQPVIPSLDGYLGWITIGGIIAILLAVWGAAVKIERRLGEINTRLGENIQRLDGDRRVIEERVNNTTKDIDNATANIDKLDSRIRDIETLAWRSSPSRAKSIREKTEEEDRTS